MPTSRRLDAAFACAFGVAPAAEIAKPATTSSTAIEAMRLDTERLPLGRLQDASQTVLEADLRLPAEELAGPRDVGLPHLRIVDRQRLEDDLALGAGDAEDRLGKVEERQLLRVSDVDRPVLAALGEQDD